MAISANTVFEVRTGGSDSNGGGFVSGASGVDYSLQDAAQVTIDLVTNTAVVHTTTTQITFALYTPSANDVGNSLNITGGTATAGLYNITAVDVPNKRWTLDRSVGTAAQTVAGAMGGAFATPGKAAIVATIDGNLIWWKGAVTSTITTSTPGAAGPVSLVSNIRVKLEGYLTTRGDRAAIPKLSAGAVTSVNLFTYNGNDTQVCASVEADGNSQTGVSGFSSSNSRAVAEDCLASHCNQSGAVGFGLSGGVGGQTIRCKASDCTIGNNSATPDRCSSDACGTGFSTSAVDAHASLCVATDCTSKGFDFTGNGANYTGCTAEGNASDGFNLSTTQSAFYCAATNNGGYGYNTVAAAYLKGCASYNNTSGRTNTACFDVGAITLSGDPWTDAANDDLRPNNTAGAGALLRNAGGGVYGQTDNRDVGAVQHADPTSGLVIPIRRGGTLMKM